MFSSAFKGRAPDPPPGKILILNKKNVADLRCDSPRVAPHPGGDTPCVAPHPGGDLGGDT